MDTFPQKDRSAPAIAAGAFVLAFAWLFFFCQGVPLYDSDYSYWLRLADESSWGRLLGQLAAPPWDSWDALDRPVATIWFKVLWGAAGRHFDVWVAAKCVAAAVFLTGYIALLRQRLGPVAACASFAVLATASPVLASMQWYSDFAMLGQLFVLAGAWAVLRFAGDAPSGAESRKRYAIWFAMAAFVCLCIAIKIKPSGRLLAPAALAFLVWRRPREWRHWWPLPAAMFGYLVAWGQLLKFKAPPFLTGEEGGAFYLYQAPSVGRWLALIAGMRLDAAQFAEPPNSFLFFLLPTLLAFMLLGVAQSIGGIASKPKESLVIDSSKHPLAKRSDFVAMLGCLAALQLLSFVSYPAQSGFFRARYLCEALPALLPLLFVAIQSRTARLFARPTHAPIALLVVIHIVAAAFHNVRQRRDTGGFFVAVDKAYRFINSELKPGQVLSPDLPELGFYPKNPGIEMVVAKSDGQIEVRLRGDEAVYALRTLPPETAAMQPVATFDAKSGAIFDGVFGADESKRLFLSRLK